MAQQAGVDLSAISRNFPPTPPFRQGSTNVSAANNDWVSKHTQTTDNNSNYGVNNPNAQPFRSVGQSGGGVAEMAENPSQDVDQVLDASALANPTFSDRLNISDLPPIIRDAAQKQATTEGRDKVILSMLNLASGFSPNVCGIYDRRLVFPPFYNFIVAPSSSQGV